MFLQRRKLSDDFISKTDTKVSESIRTGVYNTVFLIINNSDLEFLDAYEKDKEIINGFFDKQGFGFFVNPQLESIEDLKSILNYSFPFIKNNDLNFQEHFSLTKNKSGLLFIDGSSIYFTSISSFTLSYFKYYVSFFGFYSSENFSPISSNSITDLNITLDDETQREIELISKKITALEDSGQYIYILPILEKFIQNERKKSSATALLSSINVDVDLKIVLPEFNNMEVKLSPLTQSIYLLFLHNKQGINLKDLKNYGSELLYYYEKLSNRDNYDKMQLSIDKIIDISSNEIYVHLSRIKSFFYQKFDVNIARHYIVYGDKNENKIISLNNELISLNHFPNLAIYPGFYCDF